MQVRFYELWINPFLPFASCSPPDFRQCPPSNGHRVSSLSCGSRNVWSLAKSNTSGARASRGLKQAVCGFASNAGAVKTTGSTTSWPVMLSADLPTCPVAPLFRVYACCFCFRFCSPRLVSNHQIQPPKQMKVSLRHLSGPLTSIEGHRV